MFLANICIWTTFFVNCYRVRCLIASIFSKAACIYFFTTHLEFWKNWCFAGSLKCFPEFPNAKGLPLDGKFDFLWIPRPAHLVKVKSVQVNICWFVMDDFLQLKTERLLELFRYHYADNNDFYIGYLVQRRVRWTLPSCKDITQHIIANSWGEVFLQSILMLANVTSS